MPSLAGPPQKFGHYAFAHLGCALPRRLGDTRPNPSHELFAGTGPIEIEDDLRLVESNRITDHQGLAAPTSGAGDPSRQDATLWFVAVGFSLSDTFVEKSSGSDHRLVSGTVDLGRSATWATPGRHVSVVATSVWSRRSASWPRVLPLQTSGRNRQATQGSDGRQAPSRCPPCGR